MPAYSKQQTGLAPAANNHQRQEQRQYQHQVELTSTSDSHQGVPMSQGSALPCFACMAASSSSLHHGGCISTARLSTVPPQQHQATGWRAAHGSSHNTIHAQNMTNDNTLGSSHSRQHQLGFAPPHHLKRKHKHHRERPGSPKPDSGHLAMQTFTPRGEDSRKTHCCMSPIHQPLHPPTCARMNCRQFIQRPPPVLWCCRRRLPGCTLPA